MRRPASEPEGSKFKDKVRIKAYPAQELAGVIWLYMGPEPAPLLPRYDMLVWPGIRTTWAMELPCNWLQCMENSVDPLHFQWLHRYWGGWQMNKLMPAEERNAWNRQVGGRGADHRKIGFEITNYGVIKRRLVGAETEESDHWRMGHPIFFPTSSASGKTSSAASPSTTRTRSTSCSSGARSGPARPPTTTCRSSMSTLLTTRAGYAATSSSGRTRSRGSSRGAVADRTTERLGVGDVGLIMYRRLLMEQMAVVADGGDPMNTYRDPAQNEIIIAPCESFDYPGYEGVPRGPFRDIVVNNTVEAVLSGAGEELEEFAEAESVPDTPGQFSLLTPRLKHDIHAQ